MSPAELIRLPEAVSRAALFTELALLSCVAEAPLDIERIRRPFIQFLIDHDVPRPVYTRTTSTFDGFIRESIEDGLLTVETSGTFSLTDAGRRRHAELRREAELS